MLHKSDASDLSRFSKILTHIYVGICVYVYLTVSGEVSVVGVGEGEKWRGIVQRVYTVRLFNLNCFAGAVASCNDETKANNCNNFAQCASVSVCLAPSLHPLEHLSSSQTLALLSLALPVAITFVPPVCPPTLAPPPNPAPLSAFSPLSSRLSRSTAKHFPLHFRRNVPQSCK